MKKVFPFLCFVITISSVYAQKPAGDRIMAFQVDMAENNNYDSAYNYAVEACIQSIHQAFSWKAMEPVPGNISGPVYNLLDIVNLYYPAYQTMVELNIPVVNTVTREVPSDLETTPFSDPIMIARFNILLDSVFSKIPNVELAALTIGNESDIFWGTDSIKYLDFKIFLDSVSAHAKNLYFNLHGTDLNVGTTLTHDGLLHPATSNFCKQLNNDVDVISVTYYGMDQNTLVIPPVDVIQEFSELVTMYSDTSKPIYLVECGYPSSSFNASSYELQRQFIENVFIAWDTFYDNIKYISFFKTTDWSQGQVDTLAVYYGLPNDTAFKEYLRTLGLRTYPGDGTNKLSYEQLKCELVDRNWCTTTCNPVGIEVSRNDNNRLNFFPNPASDILSIQYKSEYNRSYSISIIDLNGQILLIEKKIETSEYQLNTSSLNNGMYFIQIIEVDKTKTMRLIIE